MEELQASVILICLLETLINAHPELLCKHSIAISTVLGMLFVMVNGIVSLRVDKYDRQRASITINLFFCKPDLECRFFQ